MNVKGIPNLLTALRIILIPLFIGAFVKENNTLCAVIFAISGLSDVLDGFIARRFGAESNVGKILDPIADKLTYATTFFCLCSVGRIPLYFVICFVIVQIGQGVGAIVLYNRNKVVVKSNIFGKIAGFSMFSLSFINLVFHSFDGIDTLTNILCVFVLAAIFAAGAGYFVVYTVKPKKESKQL